MKTIFVVNPKAGKGSLTQNLVESIKDYAAKSDAEIQIYMTKSQGDAQRFVKEYCERLGGARFIACGGDGTLSEVLNGAANFPDAEIGVLPMGTGNDFCRNFKGADFGDIDAQINGAAIPCDAIKYSSVTDGREHSGYSINMFNIGFDCNVADMTSEVKERTFISGSPAYLVSIFVNLIKKRGANLKIEIDGAVCENGAVLLTSIANGCYCGGGIKSNPLASVHDGFININIIKNVSRLQFMRLLPHYMKGTFLKLKGIEKIISSEKCKRVVITPIGKNMRLCNDGEISTAGRTEFEIVPDAFNFVVPYNKNTDCRDICKPLFIQKTRAD